MAEARTKVMAHPSWSIADAGIHGSKGEAIMNDMINNHDDYTPAGPKT
jgi:hypothetical protein